MKYQVHLDVGLQQLENSCENVDTLSLTVGSYLIILS